MRVQRIIDQAPQPALQCLDLMTNEAVHFVGRHVAKRHPSTAFYMIKVISTYIKISKFPTRQALHLFHLLHLMWI